MKLRADIAEDGTVTVEKQCADGQHDTVDEPEGTYVDGFELVRQCRRCGWKLLRTKVRRPYV